MNTTTKQLLITAILSFAILSNISVGAVFATGGLDDEEEEEAITQLQDQVETLNEFIQDTPCGQALAEEEPQQSEEPEQSVTQEPQVQAEEEPEGCNNNNNQQEVTQEPEPVKNETGGCNVEPEPTCNAAVPEPEQPQNNVTEQVEELIQNVTDEVIPFLPELNITEAVGPTCNITQSQEEPQALPEQQNQTETTASEIETPLANGTEIADIEFNVGCACFVLDNTPEGQ